MKRVHEQAEAEALAALAARDRRKAVSVLMDAYGPHVYTFCCSALADSATAEDVLQNVFIEVHDALPSFNGRSTLLTWILGIARHRCLDALRVRRRWFDRFLPMAPETTASEPDPAPGVEAALELRQRSSAVNNCLERLAPEVRIAVLMRCQEGYSYEEMARMSRERPATLQARVARALPVLRRCIESKESDGERRA
jgi:RNA polymerase sigma factor (sigma-70 family)